MDVLELLERKDKCYLGGGGGAVYAPPFPRYVTAPGFWDECSWADFRFPRLFTAFFVRKGRPVPFESELLSWRPDRMLIEHRGEELRILETRCVLEGNVWISRFEEREGRPFDLLVWSLFENRLRGTGLPRRSVRNVREASGTILWKAVESWLITEEVNRTGSDDFSPRQQEHGVERSGEVAFALGADSTPLGVALCTSETADERPRWENAAFTSLFRDGRLGNAFGLTGEGWLHIGAHFSSRGKPLTVGIAAAAEDQTAAQALLQSLDSDPIAASERSWRDWFAGAPRFECSDPLLTRHYWYRWYGLRLSTVAVRTETYPYPCVFEGIGPFRNLISYSSAALLRDLAWRQDPSLAQGVLENFLVHQREDGSFPGHITTVRPNRDFYHANWGDAVDRLLWLHELSPEFLDRLWSGLARYSDYLRTERDPEDSGLTTVIDQNETGQEYSSRYQWASQQADQWQQFQLKGVDASWYAFTLEWLLASRGPDGEKRAERVKQMARAIASLWDPDAAIFKDRRPGSETLSPAQSVTGFYPLVEFLPSNVRPSEALAVSLLNENEFWTPYPVATSPQSDPLFSSEGYWRGRRMNCPWNGRVWPMANAHIVDTLARLVAARPDAQDLRPVAGRLFRRWLEMMTFGGDPTRPNCFEHYDPFTGEPSAYRGVDDYMHSWLIDIYLTHLCGIDAETGTVRAPSLDCGLDWWGVSNVWVRGERIERESERFSGATD
ncbi:MAG: hypothetical protein D6724_06245 [Armatimonadetes bacterium]|nr:MAG: hypothetical protein D6724_06245 [Armatimonadota bacterium]